MIRHVKLGLCVIALTSVLDSASAPAAMVPTQLAEVRVHPNPWRSDKHAGVDVTFDQLTPNTIVKIFTISGHLVKTLPPSGDKATWNRTNDSGDDVASGVYLYLLTSPDGQHRTGQLALIK